MVLLNTTELEGKRIILSNTINIHTLIRFPSYWRFLPMSVSQKVSRKWKRYSQQFPNFVPPKIFSIAEPESTEKSKTSLVIVQHIQQNGRSDFLILQYKAIYKIVAIFFCLFYW